MSAIALVYTLFGDRDRAEAVARAMVERGLAACANLLGESRSVYRWNGGIETAAEVPVLFKTVPERREALTTAIAELHDYALPAILSWEAAASPAFAQWAAQETEG